MTKRKAFKELDLSNAFLFSAALQDEETCQLVLEMILGTSIGKVKVKAEHSILYSSDFRSIRLDIYAGNVADVQYDIEMQNKKETYLPKRSRYYQAVMDMSSLRPGQSYDDLKPSYIIFICTFDPFASELYRYTFEMKCKETGEPLGDESKTIFLNTKGKNLQEVPKALIHFLQYVEQSTDAYVEQVEDEKIRRLHDKVKELKTNRDLEGHYMKFEELLENRLAEGLVEGRAEGRAIGIEEGRKEGLTTGRKEMLQELIQKKLDKGMDISSIAKELEEDIGTIEHLVAQTKNQG